MTSTLLQQAVEALTRAHAFILNGVSLAEPADEALPAIEAAIAALESALQQPPEPVAWRHRFYKGSPPASWSNWIYTDSKPTREHAEIEPLFAAPPALQQQEEPREVREAKLVCYEAYAALGTILMDLAEAGHPQAEKLMDNLSQAKLVHEDVLPFAASPSPQDFTLPMLEEGKGADGVKLPRVGPEGWKRMAESQQALADTDRRIKEISERYGLDGDGVLGTLKEDDDAGR